MTRRLLIALALTLAIGSTLLGLCFFGIWIPNEPSRTRYPIRGIDVSHHQRAIDWHAVKTSQIHFAYIKATEGASFKDAAFGENWRNSGGAGLARGAYHFFTFETSGQLQAANFIAEVPVDAAALPPAIDLEFSGYNKIRRPSADDFRRDLSVFWDALVKHYGKIPVVYTTRDFQEQYLARMPVERLWIREIIVVPPPDWMFWQFSSRGRVAGISTFVDLNVFQGTPGDFEALTKRSSD
jgi:lysozyme